VIESSGDGILLTVRVIPRAAKAGIAGTRNSALLVRLTAPPLDNAANQQLIDVIARAFNIPRRAVTIISGGNARTKRVRIAGIDPDAVARILQRNS
jgi:uncharacterized protein